MPLATKVSSAWALALDVVASRGADDELRIVWIFRGHAAGVTLRGEKRVGLHHISIGVALDDVGQRGGLDHRHFSRIERRLIVELIAVTQRLELMGNDQPKGLADRRPWHVFLCQPAGPEIDLVDVV